MKNGQQITLNAGDHFVLMQAILDDFAPFFVPGGEPIYIGGSGAEEKYYDQEIFASLRVTADLQEKMPDVVIYDREKNWLILVPVRKVLDIDGQAS